MLDAIGSRPSTTCSTRSRPRSVSTDRSRSRPGLRARGGRGPGARLAQPAHGRAGVLRGRRRVRPLRPVGRLGARRATEFSTAYTPYQPELSQGVLQALFEFQSMVCELTALEVSNASLYDGATALVEAVNMARAGERGRVLVSEGVDLRLVETLRTYGRGPATSRRCSPPSTAGEGAGGRLRRGAAAIVQHPNALGILEAALRSVRCRATRWGEGDPGLRPAVLGVLAPPGELGADIAVAEGQSLGNHLAFGGPTWGCSRPGLRRPPAARPDRGGDGRRRRQPDTLTLQAREQHIRREKANSNICTNQTLMAVAATIYLGWLGPEGLVEVGRRSAAKASYAAGRLAQLPGVSFLHPEAPFFKEFAPAVAAARGGRRGARRARVPGRRPLSGGGGRRPARGGDGAADEGAIDGFVEALAEVSRDRGRRADPAPGAGRDGTIRSVRRGPAR